MASKVNCDFSDLYNVLDLVSKDNDIPRFTREFCFNLRRWLDRKTEYSEKYVYKCDSRSAKYCRMAQYIYWVVCVRNICSESGIERYFKKCYEDPKDFDFKFVNDNRLFEVYNKVKPYYKPELDMCYETTYMDSDEEIIEYTDDDFRVFDQDYIIMKKYYLPPMNLKYYELKLFISRIYSQPKTSEDEEALKSSMCDSEAASVSFSNGCRLPYELETDYESESESSDSE